LIFVVFLGIALIIHNTLTSSKQYGNRDFMSLYTGGRAVLNGLDPYNPQVWNPLRSNLGSTWMPDDRAPFPLWTLLIFVPFSLLNLGWAAAIWLTFSILALGIGMILLIQILKSSKPVSAFDFMVLTIFSFTFRAVLVSMHNGQITSQIFLFLVLFLLFERQERSFLAGIMLASVALKPNVFIFFVPTLGLWLLYKKRWTIIAGAAAGGLTLFILSWVVQPGWLVEWMNVKGKLIATPFTPTIWGIAYELANTNWKILGGGFVIIIATFLGWLIFSQKYLSTLHVTSLALIGSLLLTPYAWVYEQVYLLIPAIILFLSIESRWKAISLWLIITFVVPWSTLLLANHRNSDTFSVLTTLVIGLMYWYIVVFRKKGQTLRVED
jgi:hypothetical protein